jgi:Transaldolase/Fructose-6-phosphate aldolase
MLLKHYEINVNLISLWSQALVNVGADLAKLVPGRVSTEIDARLAYDTRGIIHKVYMLLLCIFREFIPGNCLPIIRSLYPCLSAEFYATGSTPTKEPYEAKPYKMKQTN